MLFSIVFPQRSTAASAVSSAKGFAFGTGGYLESEVIDFSEQFLIKQHITKTVIHPARRQPCLYPRGVLCSPRPSFSSVLTCSFLSSWGGVGGQCLFGASPLCQPQLSKQLVLEGGAGAESLQCRNGGCLQMSHSLLKTLIAEGLAFLQMWIRTYHRHNNRGAL